MFQTRLQDYQDLLTNTSSQEDAYQQQDVFQYEDADQQEDAQQQREPIQTNEQAHSQEQTTLPLNQDAQQVFNPAPEPKKVKSPRTQHFAVSLCLAINHHLKSNKKETFFSLKNSDQDKRANYKNLKKYIDDHKEDISDFIKKRQYQARIEKNNKTKKTKEQFDQFVNKKIFKN